MRKTIVIGIAGGSGSGKSTFAKGLQKALQPMKVAILSTDVFFKHPLPVMCSPRSGKILEDWNAPESIDLEKYLNSIKEQLEPVSENDVVILEGVSVLFFHELTDLMDLKIFLELDSDERMYRRIKRNMQMWSVSMEEVADYYLDAAKYAEERNYLPTKRNADIVVNGGHDFSKIIAILIAWIKGEREYGAN